MTAASAPHGLQRETFRTSRLLDFCSERELVKQIGHAADQWPLVVLKELTDNALDAAEEARAAPVIRIEVKNDTIIIADNGPGIAAETVAGILDVGSRVSSREAYASPTRGAQGNALKTILAMPFALDGAKGETLIESRGTAHRISFSVDQIRQVPKIDHVCARSSVRNGTRIAVQWPVSACSKLAEAKSHFLLMAEDFGWLNPHLSLSVIWNGERCVDFKASDPDWEKWRPSDPTSPHWYDPERLRRLMGAYIARDQDLGRDPRTVRDFVSEFRGLSGSAKRALVLEEAGALRMSLPEFFGDGDGGRIAELLGAMQHQTRPLKPRDLGFIGEDHLAARFQAVGADLRTFKYRRIFGETDGVPEVVEAAFGYRPNGANERRIITGINWSPAIGNPFRSLGPYGESLDSILSEQRAGREEPIIVVLHLARPCIDYTDHGKSAVAMSDPTLAERLKSSVLSVTKEWAKQRKAEERHASALANRHARLIRADTYNFKTAADEVMEKAYLAASADGTLPAMARQIMYQARPFIQEMMGGKPLNDQYFCQQLLPDYMEDHGVDWDVTFDDRGHFTEPHTEHSIGLGTISARKYLESIGAPVLKPPSFAAAYVGTRGPDSCFGAVLFVEKEGFLPLFEAVHLAERYDLAIMSTKGMSSTAARTIVDRLCQDRVPLLVLHDFDKAGFSIIGTLRRDTRRYIFDNKTKIVDLGLRLTDVRALDLEDAAEDAFDRGRDSAKRENLRLNGATREEAEFLLTRRVELNALTSDQLIAFIEAKLKEHGIKKLIPKADRLRNAYRLFVKNKHMEKIVKNTIKKIEDKHIAAPANLSARVATYLRKHPEERWDQAVAAIAEDDRHE